MALPPEPPAAAELDPSSLTAPAPQPWTWWGAMLFVIATLLVQFAASIFAMVGLLAVGEFRPVSHWETPVLTMTSSLGSLFLLINQRHRAGAKRLWNGRDLLDWRNWALALGALVVSAGANVARMVIEPDPAAPELNQGILEIVQKSPSIPWGPLLTLGVTVVVLAPLTEEWLFRGILLPAVQRAFGARRMWLGGTAAVLVSSLVFGLLHWPIWWVPAVYGAAIGLLSLRPQSLAMPMIVHGIINLTVFLLVLSAALLGP